MSARVAGLFALAAIPAAGGSGADTPLTLDSAAIEGGRLVIGATSEDGFTAPDLFIESEVLYLSGRPAVSYEDEARKAALFAFDLPDSETPWREKLFGTTLTATLTDGEEAVERGFAF